MQLLCLIACLVVIPGGCLALRNLTIGAFNIKVFGPTKSKNAIVMEQIRQVIFDYDVILIQEIRDKSQLALERLYRTLNSIPGVKYSFIRSERLGRSSQKEQYAFYYRPDRVDVIGSHQYGDPADIFEREPFSILVRVPSSDGVGSLQMALIGLHTRPDVVMSELEHLDEVCDDVSHKLYTQNIVVLGDLNADCSYADVGSLTPSSVFSDPSYTSLIDSHIDTTVYSTHCAYDRILVKGSGLLHRSPTGTVDRFDTRLGLTDTQAKAVSDHYPVKMTISL